MFASRATLLLRESRSHEKGSEDRSRDHSCSGPECGNRRAGKGPAGLLRSTAADLSRLTKLPGQLNPMGLACP